MVKTLNKQCLTILLLELGLGRYPSTVDCLLVSLKEHHVPLNLCVTLMVVDTSQHMIDIQSF